MLKEHDVFPEVGDETRHIRKVTPSDYKEKISNEALNSLELKFKDTI